MPQLLKDGKIVANSWQLVRADSETVPEGNILLSLSHWQESGPILSNHAGEVGLWLDSHEDIEALTDEMMDIPVIAINFPKFVDGRGFSAARLLRERCGYQGELRAIGEIIRDQLFLMQRCGFNAFQFSSEIDLAEASKSLCDFTDAYQVAADQPEPLFKRRCEFKQQS